MTVYQTSVVIACDGSSLVAFLCMINGLITLLPALPNGNETVDNSTLISICYRMTEAQGSEDAESQSYKSTKRKPTIWNQKKKKKN